MKFVFMPVHDSWIATSGIVSYNAFYSGQVTVYLGYSHTFAIMPKDYLGSDQRKVKDDAEKEDKPIQCK